MKSSKTPFVVMRRTNFPVTNLIDQNNQFYTEMGMGEAKKMAQNAGLDLVCFNEPNEKGLALCKIIDFGKWKYDEEKRKKRQNKVHKKITKEMRFSAVISEHDVGHKIKQVIEFLKDGDDVLFSMRLRGRQRSHSQEAMEKMNEIVAMVSEYGQEVSRRIGSNMIQIRIGKVKDEKG